MPTTINGRALAPLPEICRTSVSSTSMEQDAATPTYGRKTGLPSECKDGLHRCAGVRKSGRICFMQHPG
eukprot:9572176-Karenia_brevis.AAC.1